MLFKENGRDTNKDQKKEDVVFSMENQVILARKLGDVYGQRPELSSFKDIMQGTKFEAEYTEESIKNDELYVEETRLKIEEKNSSFGREVLDKNEGGFALSEMMQAIVIDQINKGWMEEFSAIMTSDFDDLRVGVDAVLKHKTGDYFGAAFDFTITSQEKYIKEKLKNNWNNSIEKRSVPTVKYFEDPETHVKSKILTPKFVIGGTKEDLEEMALAYINDKEDSLKDHKFQYLIIEQIYEQIVTVLDYYEDSFEEKFGFAKRQYERIYKTVQRMRDKYSRNGKINNIDFYEYSQKSKALQTIRRFKHTKESDLI